MFFTQRLSRFCTIALISAGMAGFVEAQQLEICDTDSIPLMTTSWADEVELDRFDPNLGILKNVVVTLTGRIVGQAAFESTDNKPSTVTTTFSASMSVFRPGMMSALTTINPEQNFVDMVLAGDGAIDFGGDSGRTFPGIDETNTGMFSAPPLISDLALFTGPAGNAGTIILPVTVMGTSTGTGAGNLILQFMQEAEATVEVCYIYNVDCNGNGIADEEELMNGAPDCNGNEILDECESFEDCNRNRVPGYVRAQHERLQREPGPGRVRA